MASVTFCTALAVFVALLGAAFGVSLGGAATGRARLHRLLFAATGVLLAVVVCDVLPDAKAMLAWPAFLLAGGSGWAAFALFSRFVYPVCPSCAFSEFETGKADLKQTAVLLLFALGLHSLLDGAAIAVGDHLVKSTSPGLLLAVGFHKLPEGFALAVLLLAAGYSRRKTLAWTTVVEAATVAGGLLGAWLLREASPHLLGLLLAHTGGGFLFLAAGTLQMRFEPTLTAPPRPLLLGITGAAFAGTAALLLFTRALAS